MLLSLDRSNQKLPEGMIGWKAASFTLRPFFFASITAFDFFLGRPSSQRQQCPAMGHLRRPAFGTCTYNRHGEPNLETLARLGFNSYAGFSSLHAFFGWGVISALLTLTSTGQPSIHTPQIRNQPVIARGLTVQ